MTDFFSTSGNGPKLSKMDLGAVLDSFFFLEAGGRLLGESSTGVDDLGGGVDDRTDIIHTSTLKLQPAYWLHEVGADGMAGLLIVFFY